MYTHRQLENNIKNALDKHRIIILYGARQTGKTTLLKNLFPSAPPSVVYLACDEERIQTQLIPDALALKRLLGDSALVVFDEMQTLANPGLILKIIHDQIPGIRAIATGSAAFDLANKVSEPLTGRHEQFKLYPLSFTELAAGAPGTDLQTIVQDCLIYGSYPAVSSLVSAEEKARRIGLIADSYLYKDVLTHDLVKNSHKVRKLLIAVALQIGSEVSYNELGTRLGLNYKTIERYVDLLEKSFVIFRLYGFSRNLRNEIRRNVKIYFYDCGVRNALINNFNPLALRADGGALFENYIIAEFIKKESLLNRTSNLYFWRTRSQQEIDLIIEKDGRLTAVEIKLSPTARPGAFNAFQNAYPNSSFELVALNNFASVQKMLE